MLNIIVAVAQNNAIGRNNELLWHISEDLKYFKRVTTGHPVIMGRKTYESIGRPLPGRRNIILTSGEIKFPPIKNPETTSAEVIHNLEDVFKIGAAEEEVFVMGGGMLYKQTFDRADKLYITKIYAEAENADTFFPVIDKNVWEVIENGEIQKDEENGIDFNFIVYKRK